MEDLKIYSKNSLIHIFEHLRNEMHNPSNMGELKHLEALKTRVQIELITRFGHSVN